MTDTTQLPGSQIPHPPESAELEQLQQNPAVQFFLKYRNQIAIALGGVLLCMAAVSGYQSWQESELASARDGLAKAVEKAVQDKEPEQLQQYLVSAPDSVQLAGYLDLAGLAKVSGEHALAAQAGAKVVTLAAGDSSELVPGARLGQAQELLQAGKAEEAYAALASQGPLPEAYLPVSLRLQARAAEAAGNKAEAVAAYKALAELKTGGVTFAKAKIEQLQAED